MSLNKKFSEFFAGSIIILIGAITFITIMMTERFRETIAASSLPLPPFLQILFDCPKYLILISGVCLMTVMLLKEKMTSKIITFIINIFLLMGLTIYSYFFYTLLTNHLQNLIIYTTKQ